MEQHDRIGTQKHRGTLDSQPISSLKLRVPLFLLLGLSGTVVLGLLHVGLGASPFTVLLAVAAAFLSLIPSYVFGWRDMPSLFVAIAGVRYVGSALIWKVFDWAPLDSGLYSPEKSFQVIFIGMMAMVGAVFLSHALWRRRPIFTEHYSPNGYRTLIVIGLIFAAAYMAIFSSKTEILGGFMIILRHGLILFPLAWIGYSWATRRKIFTKSSITVLSALAFTALAYNSRETAGYAVLVVLIFIVCHRIKLQVLPTLTVAITIAFFAIIVAPAISDARVFKRTADTTEMISLTIEQIGKRLSGNVTDPWFNPNSAYQLHYLKHSNNFTDRFVTVQELDFIVAQAENNNPIGTDRFYRGLLEQLPSIFISDKSVVTNPGYAFRMYRITPNEHETYIEVTPFGDAYSFGGLNFVFWSNLLGFLLVFILYRLFCPRLDHSLLAVFLLTAYAHQLTAGYILTIYGIAFRQLPFEILIFWLASTISQRRGTRDRSPKHVAA